MKTPPEIQRKAYGTADSLIPITAAVSGFAELKGGRRKDIERYLYTTVQVKVRDISVQQAESQLRALLAVECGEDFQLIVWEGSIYEESDFLEEVRSTVNTFSLIINLLGFVLLFAASIGILSIMMVEALGRVRQIAIQRALGASRQMVITEFFQRSIFLSLLNALVGVAIALLFASPINQLLIPVYESIGIESGGGVITGVSILIGVGTAIAAGGILGIIPVLSLLKINIAESIREG